ncbi:cytochrome c oxidase assembly protein [Mesorhizobium sp. M00.F.Ca.ET.216.01.1.1]|uniref:cytochrome c oxidase assembly protein n=1 Tax=Mesorhizobium sp. M00.F.Ca.ET.216.01.1.1 TaxID=2500528 RepID=UPI000FDA17E6|nr:cytochrome c oxidase assembly protein [Mesorhizobium sp. M00.F.Ca.ET.216.01.1.1]TGQ29411.1 cytochrome c oxidase assembly protein [Mesorhizobium sp. M00.F.Ca.ET.216.01.1.1]
MSFEALFSTSVCNGSAPEASWTLASPIALPLAAIASLYAIGAMRLWRRSGRGRPQRFRQALLFSAGWIALAAALLSPIHALGERVFAAHMIEHELLMAIAAPLLVASRPAPPIIWALPTALRQALGAAGRTSTLRAMWAFMSRPLVATILHGATIWVWHIRALFEAALQEGPLHYAQHACFLGTGLLFWWALLPRPGREQACGRAILLLFLTSLHTSLLGALLVVSPRVWYPENAVGSSLWGLVPLEDQQLAGLGMWIPAGLLYGGAALLLASIWICASARRQTSLRVIQSGADVSRAVSP